MILFGGDSRHDFALGHIVRHQFFGQYVLTGLHRRDCRDRMQVQGQGDDDRFDVAVLEQLVVVRRRPRRAVRASSSLCQPYFSIKPGRIECVNCGLLPPQSPWEELDECWTDECRQWPPLGRSLD